MRGLLRDHGGFLCPPVDEDMAMALRDGVTLVCVREGDVVGFNRMATDPQVVFRSVREGLRLDPSIDHSDGDRLPDWSGRVALTGYRTLTRVGWLDRGRASVAFKSAKAGLDVTSSSSRRFAYSEEDVRLRDDTLVTVRWNHWPKQY